MQENEEGEESGRSPGAGNDNPLQYSSRDKPMDRGARWAIVHEVAQSWMRLSTHTQSDGRPSRAVEIFIAIRNLSYG